MVIDRQLLAASWRSWISNSDRPQAGPHWLQWLWTALFAAGLAVPFTLIGFFTFASDDPGWRQGSMWLTWYGRNLVVSLTIGAVIQLLFDLGRRWFASPERVRGWNAWQRALFFSGVPMLGVAIGWPLGIQLAGADVLAWIGGRDGNRVIVGTVLLATMMTLLFHTFFAAKSRQFEAEKRATEARLQLLQAQIEPHFLFNTLANVQSLLDHDLPKARQMLEAFTDYLRSSLTTLRHERSPLSQELELARSYLLLLQARMEDRLHFSIHADEAAARQPLPPLLLQPLVENAIVHGLEPSIEGGHVRLSAQVQGQRLVLEVQDDGRGLDAPARRGARPGAGMALANIRQRLQARYGDAATFEVTAAHPGTLARITLPLEAEASS